MRKVSKNTLMIVCAVMVAVGLLVTKLFVELSLDQAQHSLIMNTMEKLKGLNHTVNENVLRSRAFMLQTYDPIVEEIDEMRSTCNALKEFTGLKAKNHAPFREKLAK